MRKLYVGGAAAGAVWPGPCVSIPSSHRKREWPVSRERPNKTKAAVPRVGVVMGSRSDWETLKHAVQTLREFGIATESRVVSAHRTPDWLFRYAESAPGRGLRVLIAGAGGAAHLPGMLAAKTVLPVFGVPVETRALGGLDSLLSIAQMPAGIPVGTLAIGKAGAINAALLAAAVLALENPGLARRLVAWRRDQTRLVLRQTNPEKH